MHYYFPLYAQLQVYGVVAGMNVPESVAKYAMNNGLYVLKQSGEAVSMVNPIDFAAKKY